jgi:hypothetical protein
MSETVRLPLPVAPSMWAVAGLSTSRPQMRALLGEPHYIETDPRCTCGGEEDAWAYVLPCGHRVIVIVDATTGGACLGSDPPDVDTILRFLQIERDDPRLTRLDQPVRLC